MSHVLTESVPALRQAGFWRRQFSLPVTGKQTIFDIVFGIVLPIACLVFDPGFVRGDILGASRIPWSLAVVPISSICMLALGTWCAFRNWHGWVASVFAGVFFVGGLLALAIGVVMLPFSLPLLIAIIGALGLVPLFTAFVYLRCGVRALRRASSASRPDLLAWLAAVLFVGLAVAYPVVVDQAIERGVEEVNSLDPAVSSAAVKRMKQWRVFLPDREFERLAGSEIGTSRGQWKLVCYRRAYRLISGRTLNEPWINGGD